MLPPPSFVLASLVGSLGAIHRSWLSPWGTLIWSGNVSPPSVLRYRPVLRAYTVFSSIGSA